MTDTDKKEPKIKSYSKKIKKAGQLKKVLLQSSL